jgi:hypothetical protein
MTATSGDKDFYAGQALQRQQQWQLMQCQKSQ